MSQKSFMCVVFDRPVKSYRGLMQHLSFFSAKQTSEIRDSTVTFEENESTPTQNQTRGRNEEISSIHKDHSVGRRICSWYHQEQLEKVT